MEKSFTALCTVVLLAASLMPSTGGAVTELFGRANENAPAPVWNVGDNWNMTVNYNPDTTSVVSSMGIDITIHITNYHETTTHTVKGKGTWSGHECHVLTVVSSYGSSGTWDAGGGLSGTLTDTGSQTGEQYQRVSDLGYLGSDLNMTGTQDMGLGAPAAYSVRATTTIDAPTTYFQFPLVCSSPNQTWHTSSTQTTQVTGTGGGQPISETEINIYNFDSFVEEYGPVNVPAGNLMSFRIRNAGTWTLNGQARPYNGNISYVPDARHEARDTNVGMVLNKFELMVPKPDLFVGAGNVTFNSTPTQGAPVLITANVTNKVKQGAMMGNASEVTVRFLDGATQIGDDQLCDGNITPGTVRSFNLSWTPSSSGSHAIKVQADPDGFVVEHDKTNNEATVTVNVLEPRPDLTLSPSDIVMPAQPGVNTDVRINATIHNTGSLGASSIPVRIYDGTTQIGSDVMVSSISAGELGYASVVWHPTVLGPHNIRVRIDETNFILEISKTNNEAAIAVTVGKLPYAFSMTGQSEQQNTNPGVAAVYSYTLQNVGTQSDTLDIRTTTSPPEWTALPSKNTITFASSGSDTFALSVTPPPNALSGAFANITITATSRGNSTMKSIANTLTTVNRVYGAMVNLTTSQNDLHGLPGETKTYNITVKNTGNDKDSFDMTVDSQKGWTTLISGDRRTSDLSFGDFATVKFKTTIPSSEIAGEKDVVAFTVKSHTNTSYTEELQVVTTVDQLRDLSMSVSTPDITVDPGNTGRYTIRILNNGNGKETLTLRLNSTPELPADWTLSLDSNTDVQPGKEREITLSIGTRDDALARSFALTFEAYPKGVGTPVTRSLTFTVKQVVQCAVEAPFAYLRCDAGKTVTFTLTVRNDGNAEDTLTLTTVGLSPSYVPQFLDQASFKLAAKNTKDVTLTIKVPSGASGDVSFSVQVKSLKDSSKTGSVLLTVAVKPKPSGGMDFLPLALVGVIAAVGVGGAVAFAMSRRKKGGDATGATDTAVSEIKPRNTHSSEKPGGAQAPKDAETPEETELSNESKDADKETFKK